MAPPEHDHDQAESIAYKRLGPGIMMLSSTMQLLYSDRRTWELLGCMNKAPGVQLTHGMLPPPVTELCSEILDLLKARTEANDWEQFRVKRVLGGPERSLLVCGFGLPEQERSKSRILVTIEELGRRQEAVIDQAKDLFRLTAREVAVVEHLLKGWTNKEIANALKVTEQTVKEHIKHIMAKTKTSTRTAILVQVLRL